MKNAIAIILFSFIGMFTFSQKYGTTQCLKYETIGPDGAVAITITDDTREDSMKVKSADPFYKYQIVDHHTNELVYVAENNGKECVIDKNKLSKGSYDLKLYTDDFVITTDLEILKLGEFYAILKNDRKVAMNNE